MKLKNNTRIILGILILIGATLSSRVYAASYAIEQLPDKTIYNDFVVGPGKYQVDMEPGETKVVNMIITNRLGKEKTFGIQMEDFRGSRDLEQTVVLLDGEKGPYSLKDYIKVDSMTFTLGHAQRATIPVRITIPTDAEPGGLFGSVVISVVTTPQEQVLEGEDSKGVNPIITRIGSLFFIRVPGDVKEDLNLKDFYINSHSKVLGSSDLSFGILYENNGSVSENPKGFIYVKNIFDSEIARIKVEPWFILPDSLRLREVDYTAPLMFGRYTATLDIDKGYDGQRDNVTVAFWVIPWKIVAIVFVGLALIVFIVRWLASKISISVKK